MGIALSRTGLSGGALVTAAFVVIPLLCGLWVVRVTLRDELTLTTGTRVGLAVAGAVSLFTWAGFILGPVIVLALSVTPSRLLPGVSVDVSPST
jgi:hypothetical protein